MFNRRQLLAGIGAAAVLRSQQAAGQWRAQLKPPAKRPYMLLSAGELPGLRDKLARDPSKRIYELVARRAGARGGDTEALILTALVTGERPAMQAAGKSFMASFRGQKSRGPMILSGEVGLHHLPRPGAQGPRYDFSVLRYVHRLCHEYDFVEDVLGDEERKEFREHVVWVVEGLLSPEVRAINARYENRRHNFHSDNITIIATAALMFPAHPKARQWLEYALADLDWQLSNGVEDGAWHENPRYHGAVLRSLVPLAYALRRNAGVDVFTHDGLRAMLDWLVKTQTPADRVYGKWLQDGHASYSVGAEGLGYPRGALALSPCSGDGEWVSYWLAVAGMAAPAYRQSDPAFAARLMWAWERAGGPYFPETALPLAPLILIDPSIRPAPQKLASVGMPKVGYAVMRSGSDDPDEKYMFFDCGPRRTEAWAKHKHRDLNGISLFAGGVPLSLDAGAGNYRTPTHDMWNRATVAHSTVLFADRDQDPEDGALLQFVSKPGADYALGDASLASRVLQFYRHVLFVKPDYFVVWDFIRSYVPAEWLLHSPAKEIIKGERTLEFITPWGMSLDAHFLLPEGKLEVWEGEGPFGAARSAGERGAPPFVVQKYVRVKNQPAKDFLTVLHPRKSEAAKLSVRRAGGEHVLEVKIGPQTDIILLFPVAREYKDERDISMTGRVAVIRQGPQGDSLTLLDGTRLAFKGRQA